LVESYDIDESAAVRRCSRDEAYLVEWQFHLGSTDRPEHDRSASCDMMFFDTLHTYEQLSLELQMHARKATRYLGFHDTHTCWHQDKTGSNPRALAASVRPLRSSWKTSRDEYKTVFRDALVEWASEFWSECLEDCSRDRLCRLHRPSSGQGPYASATTFSPSCRTTAIGRATSGGPDAFYVYEQIADEDLARN
jgi:hypothetical protein